MGDCGIVGFYGVYCVCAFPTSHHHAIEHMADRLNARTFTCISVVPVANTIVSDLNHGTHGTKSSSVLLVTIWELGEAAGPLFIAPLSEIYGRYPVFNTCNILFILGVSISALSQSVNLLIFARFLTGCAVASNVLNPAIIGDMFPSAQRGSAMSVVMMAPLLGGAIGPAIAGAIAQSAGWRKIMLMAVCLAVVCEVCFLVLLRETYKPAILRRAEDPEAVLDEDEEEDSEAKEAAKSGSPLWDGIARPWVVFASSFVLQIFSLYGALVFTFFYVMSTTLPDILQNEYDFLPSMVGTAFISFSIGSVVGLVVCNTLLDRIYTRLADPATGKSAPENRLPLIIFGAFTVPIAVAFYGWSAQFHLPAPILLLAVVLIGFCVLLGIVPVMAYVVDAFNLYSASAMTAVLITRCLMGTFLPLVTEPLTDAIGYGWGFTVLAGACLVLAPIPLLVMRYGARWRQKSEYTRDT